MPERAGPPARDAGARWPSSQWARSAGARKRDVKEIFPERGVPLQVDEDRRSLAMGVVEVLHAAEPVECFAHDDLRGRPSQDTAPLAARGLLSCSSRDAAAVALLVSATSACGARRLLARLSRGPMPAAQGCITSLCKGLEPKAWGSRAGAHNGPIMRSARERATRPVRPQRSGGRRLPDAAAWAAGRARRSR